MIFIALCNLLVNISKQDFSHMIRINIHILDCGDFLIHGGWCSNHIRLLFLLNHVADIVVL